MRIVDYCVKSLFSSIITLVDTIIEMGCEKEVETRDEVFKDNTQHVFSQVLFTTLHIKKGKIDLEADTKENINRFDYEKDISNSTHEKNIVKTEDGSNSLKELNEMESVDSSSIEVLGSSEVIESSSIEVLWSCN
ncbi:hypothetical protein NGRA_1033 [Nosema granulosis]|uniref:Uncharacterized protein n=1 Tax=Nosema granulosis TaxID=83296 RepID=A0A9P6H094_9MICR|nr:hypothetical protein NGRA_1033 [Nosema granulosis]